MKALFKISLLVLGLSFSWNAKAHNPDLSSTLLVEQSEGQWVLQIRAALTAFEYAIESRFGKEAYASPEEFQELVQTHLKENTSIFFNDENKIELKNGQVQLGHETRVSFELSDFQGNIETLNIANSSFAAIPRNQGALIVLKKEFEKEQFVMNNANQHSVQLEVQGSKFVMTGASVKEARNPFYLFGAMIAIAATLLVLLIAKLKPTFSKPSIQLNRN